jgi:hypothetical protein
LNASLAALSPTRLQPAPAPPEHLYGEREWTMERIAEALGVHEATISRERFLYWKVG